MLFNILSSFDLPIYLPICWGVSHDTLHALLFEAITSQAECTACIQFPNSTELAAEELNVNKIKITPKFAISFDIMLHSNHASVYERIKNLKTCFSIYRIDPPCFPILQLLHKEIDSRIGPKSMWNFLSSVNNSIPR